MDSVQETFAIAVEWVVSCCLLELSFLCLFFNHNLLDGAVKLVVKPLELAALVPMNSSLLPGPWSKFDNCGLTEGFWIMLMAGIERS